MTRPEVGTELVDPVVGTKTVFVETAESTGGADVEVEATYPPDSPRPARHVHPRQIERSTILARSLEVRRGEESSTADAGDEFTVEPGVAHQMWAGSDGAVFRWRTSPALRTGELYCSTWECARDNNWAPTGLQMFEAAREFGDEFRVAQRAPAATPGDDHLTGRLA